MSNIKESTRKIALIVPYSFNISNLLKRSNPSATAQIITLGEQTYLLTKNSIIDKSSDVNIQLLNRQMVEMKKNNIMIEENWNIKLNNVRKEHIDSLNDMHNKNLTKRKIIIESIEDEHNLLTKSKIQEINDLKNNFNNQKEKEISF